MVTASFRAMNRKKRIFEEGQLALSYSRTAMCTSAGQTNAGMGMLASSCPDELLLCVHVSRASSMKGREAMDQSGNEPDGPLRLRRPRPQLQFPRQGWDPQVSAATLGRKHAAKSHS